MTRTLCVQSILLGGSMLLSPQVFAQSAAVPNWPAPLFWSAETKAGNEREAAITGPLALVGVTPCRVAETRPEYAQGLSGAFGPPSFSGRRDFPIPLSAC
jgi:hypothetical protein